MHWFYLLLALGCFALTLLAGVPGALVVVLLLLAFAFLVAWIFGFIAGRLSSRQRDDTQIISPDELRRLREMAQARKAGNGQDSDPV